MCFGLCLKSFLKITIDDGQSLRKGVDNISPKDSFGWRLGARHGKYDLILCFPRISPFKSLQLPLLYPAAQVRSSLVKSLPSIRNLEKHIE